MFSIDDPCPPSRLWEILENSRHCGWWHAEHLIIVNNDYSSVSLHVVTVCTCWGAGVNVRPCSCHGSELYPQCPSMVFTGWNQILTEPASSVGGQIQCGLLMAIFSGYRIILIGRFTCMTSKIKAEEIHGVASFLSERKEKVERINKDTNLQVKMAGWLCTFISPPLSRHGLNLW